MLHNLSGSEGIPSPELVRDLRVLCQLGETLLAEMAEAFASLPDDITGDSLGESLLPRLPVSKAEPERLSTAFKAALFLWQQWARRELTRAQIIADLDSLGVSADELANVSPLLAAMESKLGAIRRRRAESLALGTGLPQIESVSCVVDARAVFKSPKHDEERGGDQPYFDFDHFVPIVILEIISELNDERTTQSYALTEKTLDQLRDILARADRRLEAVKAQLPERKGSVDAPSH